ncbi:MAG: hypothetical protein M3X11_04160 [Acidobacteriota bacterium]|nr:hypothetical protein [Acidobacteriota bacterium]
MEQVTLEKVLTEAQELSANDQHLLKLWLDTKLSQQEGFKSIEDIAPEQGKRPVSFQELLGPEPEDNDDDMDEFPRERYETRGRSNGRKSIEQLMREQGTRPLKFEEMSGNFWPEDENIDDFVSATRTLRQQTELRSLE